MAVDSYVLLLSFSTSSGVLDSSGILLSCSIVTISLHITIILTIIHIVTSTSLHLLYRYCDHLDLLTDSLYMHDVENVVDDPRFFVFEEELKECVMCFSRDSWVRNNAAYVVHSPATGLQYSNSSSGSSGGLNHSSSSSSNGDKRALGGVGNSENGNNKKMPSSIPTSNVQPFLGFAIYSAPLCYIFNYMKLPSLYSVMRAMWARIWCKLNVISADNGTLVHVCATFEALLMQVSLNCRWLYLCIVVISASVEWFNRKPLSPSITSYISTSIAHDHNTNNNTSTSILMLRCTHPYSYT